MATPIRCGHPALAGDRRMAGRRDAALSHSGGIGGLLDDLRGDIGLEVPLLTPPTRERLSKILAERRAVANPTDVTMHYQTEAFGEIVRLFVADPGIELRHSTVPPLAARP